MKDTKLTKQQKKILETIETLIKVGDKLDKDPRYYNLSVVRPLSIQTKNKKSLIPIRYISRILNGWKKQSPSFNASFSRSLKRLEERVLIDKYVVKTSAKRSIKCINLTGIRDDK